MRGLQKSVCRCSPIHVLGCLLVALMVVTGTGVAGAVTDVSRPHRREGGGDRGRWSLLFHLAAGGTALVLCLRRRRPHVV